MANKMSHKQLSEARLKAANKIQYNKVCPNCGTKFTTGCEQKVVCSNLCRDIHNGRYKDNGKQGDVLKEFGQRIFRVNRGAVWPV